MNWDDFFTRTLEKSGLSSYAQLAPKLGISDGAISHYRTGKRVPQVWVVAEALKVQGHPQPERAAIEIMKAAALTSPERTFWRRLAATATLLAVGVIGGALQPAQAATFDTGAAPTQHYAQLRYWAQVLRDWLAHKLHRPMPATDCIEARAWI